MASKIKTNPNVGRKDFKLKAHFEDDGYPVDAHTKKLFEGDSVVYRTKHPQDYFPTQGVILSPNHPLVAHSIAEQKRKTKDKGIDDDKSIKYYVQWARTQNVQHVRREELSLVNRQLHRGQLVKNARGVPGIVTDLVDSATVRIHFTNNVLENIPVNKLYPMTTLVRGQDVMYKGWVGTITTVKRHINFRMLDGGVVYFPTMENDGFMHSDPYWPIGAQCPGTQIKVSPEFLSKSRLVSSGPFKRFFWNWPFVNYLYSMDRMTYLKPSVIAVSVKWICKNPLDKKASVQAPDTMVKASELHKVVSIGKPSSETLLYNSIRLYNIHPSDSTKSQKTWYEKFDSRYLNCEKIKTVRKSLKPVNPPKTFNAGSEAKVSILLRQTKAQVEWEDGSVETLMSTELDEVEQLTDNASRCGLVVEKAFFGEKQRSYGIIHPKPSGYKMVYVRWIGLSMDSTEGDDGDGLGTDLGLSEESIYDIVPHTEYCLFQKGTIVFLKTSINGIGAGTVVDLDLQLGKMHVATPTQQEPVIVWPHLVVPMTKRCYWNFFTQAWVVNDYIPPTYAIEMPFQALEKTGDEPVPVEIPAGNNNILDNTEDDDSLSGERFEILDEAPNAHSFYKYDVPKFKFFRNYAYEGKYLKSGTPKGVWVRAYHDRMDLLSILYRGPKDTPYEDGLYMFDLQLTKNFPEAPPKIRFINHTSAPISPLIDQYSGEFCVSSLNWESLIRYPSLILSAVERIKSVIFHADPLFQVVNKVPESPQELERSRAYNEKVFINVMSSHYLCAMKPHEPWRQHIQEQLSRILPEKINFLKQILDEDPSVFEQATYRLFPVTRAFETSLKLRLEKLEELLPVKIPQFQLKPSNSRGIVELEAIHVNYGVRPSRSTMDITENDKDSDEENNILPSVAQEESKTIIKVGEDTVVIVEEKDDNDNNESDHSSIQSIQKVRKVPTRNYEEEASSPSENDNNDNIESDSSIQNIRKVKKVSKKNFEEDATQTSF